MAVERGPLGGVAVNDRDASIRIEGARELRRALKAAGDDLTELKEANQAAARVVFDAAERTVPRRSGALARSGRVNKAATRGSVVYGGARVPYAAPIHWGWAARGIEAQPWVTDAAYAERDEVMAIYLDAVNQITTNLERTP